MKIVYSSKKVEQQCTSIKAARKIFGGDEILARSLLARINALEQAVNIKDIIVQPAFRFHALTNKKGRNLKGYFAIDVKTIKEAWRVILQPLNENLKPYALSNIDEIAINVRIIEITEVSKHYE